MSPPSPRQQLANLAALSGRKLTAIPPDPLGEAALRVSLTTAARQNGATWARISLAAGHGDPLKAKRDARRLKAAVARELRLRVNAVSLAQEPEGSAA